MILRLWAVEWSKLWSRLSTRLATVVALTVPLFTIASLLFLKNSPFIVNGQPLAETLDLSLLRCGTWALWIRNGLYVVPAFVVVMGTLSTASEFEKRTLREDLLRPVPRWQVLLAKWLAIVSWTAVVGIGSLVLSQGLGLVLFGMSEGFTTVLRSHALAICCDAGLAAMVLLAGLLTRSTAGSIAGMLMFLFLNLFLYLFVNVLQFMAAMLSGSELLVRLLELEPWLPTAALGVWRYGLGTGDVVWQSMASLVLFTVGSLALGALWFRRMDVP